MSPEVKRIVVLSTAHMPKSEPDFGGLRAEPHEYGYILFLLDDKVVMVNLRG